MPRSNPSHGSRLLCAAAALAALGSAGCNGGACDAGNSYCRGRSLMTCEKYGDDDSSLAVARASHHWVMQTCAHACVDPGAAAFCALSSERDRRCPDQRDGYCADTDAVVCRDGFAIERTACGKNGRVCAIAGDGGTAVCADPVDGGALDGGAL